MSRKREAKRWKGMWGREKGRSMDERRLFVLIDIIHLGRNFKEIPKKKIVRI